MEKLPTIILPPGSDGDATSSPRTGGPCLGQWEQPKVPTSSSPLRIGGIRLRCPRPQQLVEDFYVKRLGMQELSLASSAASGSEPEPLEFRLVPPQKQQLQQMMHLASSRSPRKLSIASITKPEPNAAQSEGFWANKNSLKECDGYASKANSRRTSFGSPCSSRNGGVGLFPSSNRFVAFGVFSTAEVEAAVREACETGDTSMSNPSQKNWLKSSCGQFVVECVPVKKYQGLYKPYEHHGSDVFSRISFCMSDVDAATLYLTQHMIRVQPAGQFLDMGYAASFLDPQNFRGRLIQYMSEYKMASRKALLSSESKSPTGSTDSAIKLFSPEREKRLDSEAVEAAAAPSEEGGDPQALSSPPSSSISSTAFAPASLLQAEREGCLPTPTIDELKAVGSEDASSGVNINLETLPSDRPPVLHHIELRATDAESTLAFYEEVLGMTLIAKRTAQGFGFTLYYLAFEKPTHTSYRYWLWLQRYSCICIKVSTDGSRISPYQDLEPAECGFLGISLLCSEADKQSLLQRFQSKNVNVDYVDDEVYGRKVMLLRDPQNVPIRIAITN